MKNGALFVKKLSWLERAWLLTPIAIWFSYQPLVRFGQDTTTYYEISIAILYLFVVGLVGIPNIWRARKALLADPAVSLGSTFVGLSVLSLLWTPNVTRGVLTVGIVGLLYLVLLAALAERERLKKLLPNLSKILVISAAAVSALAFLQVIAGIWLPSGTTLLCAGCTADQFGFVRPNVFAIEPQFLGSLLIAPLLVLLHDFLKGKRSLVALMHFVLISSALSMTLSRGAIFAFALGVLILFVLNFRAVKLLAEATLALIAAFAVALVVQGTAATLNPRVDVTFYGAVSTSISQLSLGKITLPAERTVQSNSNETAPVFNGYVEESTDTRLSLTQLALGTWKSTPSTIFFGVGIGGTGAAIHAAYPEKIDAREIVQNQYVEILLEYGLVGLVVFVGLLMGFLWGTRQSKWAWAFLGAYAVQWWFFSGYPNALHVYLVLIVLYAVFRVKPTERRA
jgi:hypothetical protein